jgi:hypothetical protein
MDSKILAMLAMLGFVMRPTTGEDVGRFSMSGQSMEDAVATQEQVVETKTSEEGLTKVADDGFLDKWIDSCQARIDKSWVKPDARFGYKGHASEEISPLMHQTASNVVPLFTAGVFDRHGSMSLDTDTMSERFGGAIENVLLAFRDAAVNAMHN